MPLTQLTLIYCLVSFSHLTSLLPWLTGFNLSFMVDKQRIRTIEDMSDWTDLHAGVQQGSVCSPLLFSIFINEVTKIVSSHFHLYADDLQLYRNATISDLPNTINAINLNSATIKDWADSFGLLINPNKSQVLVIGSQQMRARIKLCDLPSVSYNGLPIAFTSSARI